MGEPAPRPWKNLPADLLNEIARHLPCLVDRLYMSRACLDWWFAVQRPPPPCQLPSLLLPDTTDVPLPVHPGSGNMRRATFCCAIGNGDTHNLRIGHDTGGARFFGSYDGGWLLLAHDQTNHHALLNLHTGRRLFLPDSAYFERGGVWTPVFIDILTATLSSPPGQTTQCFGAAIIDKPCGVHSPKLAFWSMERAGDRCPMAIGLMGNPWFRFEDVIHHNGYFHFLTDAEDVIVYDIFMLQEEEEGVHYGADEHPYYFIQGAPRNSNVVVIARYLVESRGELLMVVRLLTDYPEPGWIQWTGAFQVYRVTQYIVGACLVQFAWTELSSLDGRMLFVARGCSRAYEVADFPGISSGGGIYFLDDWNSSDVVPVSEYGILEWTGVDGWCRWVEEEPLRRYNCSDNGSCLWVEGEQRLQVVRRWFTDKECSNYSSPVWFIP